MKRLIIVGICAIIAGGIIVNIGINRYNTYDQLNKLVEKSSRNYKCEAESCDTSYLQLPAAFLRDATTLLAGGLSLFTTGLSLIVIRREDL
jgi:hypothetical protein